MKENRNALIQIRCTPMEKNKIQSIQTLLNEKSVSEMMLKAIVEFTQSRLSLNLDEFSREKKN